MKRYTLYKDGNSQTYLQTSRLFNLALLLAIILIFFVMATNANWVIVGPLFG